MIIAVVTLIQGTSEAQEKNVNDLYPEWMQEVSNNFYHRFNYLEVIKESNDTLYVLIQLQSKASLVLNDIDGHLLPVYNYGKRDIKVGDILTSFIMREKGEDIWVLDYEKSIEFWIEKKDREDFDNHLKRILKWSMLF